MGLGADGCFGVDPLVRHSGFSSAMEDLNCDVIFGSGAGERICGGLLSHR